VKNRFLVLFIFVINCHLFAEDSAELTREQCKNYIHEFERIVGKQIEQKFNLSWIQDDYLHNYSINTIEFYAYRRATVEEARALALAVSNTLIEAIQANPQILSYLSILELSPDSLGIDVRFVNSRNFPYDDGSINHVYTKKENDDFGMKYLAYTSTDPFSDYLDKFYKN
jgi:hypothetical protein